MVVGLYPGSSSIAVAEAAGLRVADVPEVAKEADVVMMVIPDHVQGRIYREQIAPNLKPGSAFMVAHGFSIHYGEIVLPDNMDVMMVAPKAPGHRMRELFVEGVGVPSLLAVHQDATGNAKQSDWPMPRASAAPGPACWKPPSRTRPRATCSASRASSAAE